MGKNWRREKKRTLYISISIYQYLLQRMQGDINREVFPIFLANKSYDWWITRRRMEIYTKISKRKDLVWSRQKQGKIRTTQGGVRIWKVLCENFAQAWSSCLPKAISSSFQIQIIHGLKRWILDFLSFEMVYSM